MLQMLTAQQCGSVEHLKYKRYANIEWICHGGVTFHYAQHLSHQSFRGSKSPFHITSSKF